MEKLLSGILSKQPELDLVITKAAPEWPIDRISPVDRNILRLGLFELLFFLNDLKYRLRWRLMKLLN